jgi:hypothetical protein
MLAEHFTWVLWITGAITATPVLQFLAPRVVLRRLNQIELGDDAGVFYARHWGALAATFGGLLLLAAARPELRPVVVTAAMIEKAALVAAFAVHARQPFAKGLRLAAAFDGTCVILYALWLVTT